MHIELALMLVIGWMLLVVDGSETVQSSSHLENVAHFILKKFFSSAVVIKAEVSKIIEVIINLACVIKHKVEVEEKSLELDPLIEIEGLYDSFDPVDLDN